MIYVLDEGYRALAQGGRYGYDCPLGAVVQGGALIISSGWMKVYWHLYVVTFETGWRNKSPAVLAAVAAERFYLDSHHPNIPIHSSSLFSRRYSRQYVSLTSILWFHPSYV